LLAREGGWTSATDLSDEGYSKRNIARVLSGLQEAELVVVVQGKGAALRYRLARAETLRALVQGAGLASPPWRAILDLVLTALGLSAFDSASSATRRVEAHNLAERLRPVTEQLWIDAPPATRGDPDAWNKVHEWLEKQFSALADGTSPAFGVEAVRAVEVPGGAEAWVSLRDGAPDHGRVAENLRHPESSAAGMRCEAVMPTDNGWTAHQLIFQPTLEPQAIRNRVEHLIGSLKVAWRSVVVTA
jgi:hypothetical protein